MSVCVLSAKLTTMSSELNEATRMFMLMLLFDLGHIESRARFDFD